MADLLFSNSIVTLVLYFELDTPYSIPIVAPA